jgi:hypothetical protein
MMSTLRYPERNTPNAEIWRWHPMIEELEIISACAKFFDPASKRPAGQGRFEREIHALGGQFL